MEEDAAAATAPERRESEKKKGKHDKPKPWDEDPNIDHWKIEKFDPSWNPDGMVDVTEFEIIFPRYLEKYLQQVFPSVSSALKSYGVFSHIDLVKGVMLVRTTRKTKDPYIIVKARELLWLLGRSVPAPQAIKILDDEMHSDIIKISTLIKNKEQFVKRRQRLVGPNGSTLKALEILTGCYILVQGGTVAAMGTSIKGLKQVRRVAEDCILNKMHPVYHIKILMMKKELEKDPTLKNENWDRFLPKFKKKNTKKKKEMTEEEKKEEEERKKKKAEKDARRKKSYSPFPPPQPPSKEDIELETGEYFLTDINKQKQKWQEKQEKQAEKTAENKRKREAAYIPPKEPVQEDRGKSEDNGDDVAAMAMSLKKKSKEFGKLKSAEKVNAEEYIAVSGDQSAKKKSKKK